MSEALTAYAIHPRRYFEDLELAGKLQWFNDT